MGVQLILIDDSDRDWRLDDHTREVGLRGIAAARELLRQIPRRHPDSDDHDHGVHGTRQAA